MHQPSVFKSFFMGGFECSTHRRRDGRRLDLLNGTQHDRLAASDYAHLREHGMRSFRDGLRWHLIETSPGKYDWSSFLPMLRAANQAGAQVSWDLCHYGWPDDLDIWSPQFTDRFAKFCGAAARLIREEGGIAPIYSPINEISYWSWTGGEMGTFWPLGIKRGNDFKQQLARTAIAAVHAIREADPRARTMFVDPLINVVEASPATRDKARQQHEAQYDAWDMVSGLQHPEFGGSRDLIDLVGVNYYSENQWYVGNKTIAPGARDYRPLSELLADIHRRYDKPIVVAETGAEGEPRASWLQYVCDEVFKALESGLPLEGICLYPVLDYPGWINNRVCETGLLGYADENGVRPVYRPLAQQLAFQQARLHSLQSRQPSPAAEAVV